MTSPLDAMQQQAEYFVSHGSRRERKLARNLMTAVNWLRIIPDNYLDMALECARCGKPISHMCIECGILTRQQVLLEERQDDK